MKYTKKNYFLIIGLLVCCYIHVQAQDDYIYHNWGKLKYDTIYSVSYNTKNTEDRFHRDNYLTRNDWCCEFRIEQTMDLLFSHCGSEVEDTYLTILDEHGNIIDDNDDNMGEIDPIFGIDCEQSCQAQLYKQLPPGVYSIYSEGVFEDGDISLSIHTKRSNTGIDGMANPIDLGVLDEAFPVLSLKDCREYKNSYSFSSYDISGDVVYRFEIQKTMKLIITVDGGTRSRVALLDGNHQFLKKLNWGLPPEEQNKQMYFLNEKLVPGLYYLVCSTYNNFERPISTYFNTRNLPVEPQNPSTQNFVMITTPFTADKYSGLTTIKYYDGLGRESVTVKNNFTTNNNDLYTSQQYDKAGRRSALSLPVPYSGGGYYLDPQVVYFLSRKYYNDEHAYIEQQYEQSSLNRITKQYGAGENWYNNNKCASTDYLLNETNGKYSCARYRVLNDKLQKTGFYNSNELSIAKSTDEDNNCVYTFKDKENRTVLIRQFNNTITHDTYYVYDDSKNLRYVLPPLAADSLSEITTWDLSNKILKNYAYYYAYDYRNRIAVKRLPGCDPIRYVYDVTDRLIFTQNGVQKKKNEWTFSIPDHLGRETIIGCCKLAKVEDSLGAPVYAKYNPQINWQQTGYQIFNLAENSLLMDSITILNVNYYDCYRFLDLPEFAALKNEMISSSTKLLDTKYTYLINGIDFSAKGVIAGSKTTLLNTSEIPIVEASYYDKKQQKILSVTSNHLGGYERSFFKYNFIGKPLKYLHEHTALGKSDIKESYDYTYEDHLGGRLLKTTHQLNNGTVITLAENFYDELGRIQSKKLGGEAENVNYNYNIRDWITGINSDRYKQNLFYEESFSGSIPCFNGNISAMNWTLKDDIQRGYSFNYDGLNRITTADYQKNDTNSDKNYSTTYAYDKMGNIKNLTRYGLSAKPSTFGMIDNLTLNYNGNQLSSVTDASTNEPSYSGAFNFVKASVGTPEYTYDANGNLTRDSHKKIAKIQYNILNLPSVLQFTQGHTTEYLYDASGVKRRVKQITAAPDIFVSMGTIRPVSNDSIKDITQTDYCSNVIYENGTLSRILVDGGYITMSGATPTYHYYIQDHQGNNRVVFNQNGTIEQTNHYYPFGMTFGEGFDNSDNRYKYNVKELDRMHGLDLYDYGARHYDAAIGRWGVMDPLAEKYYSTSPYVYCENNTIKFIDPDGREKINSFNPKTEKKEWASAYLYKDNNAIHIFAHGNKDGIKIYMKEGKYMDITTPKDFEIYLSKYSKIWNNRKDDEHLTIVLHSCNTGREDSADDESFARKLSKELKNTTIIAPNQVVTVDDETYKEKGVYTTTSVDDKKFVKESDKGFWIQYDNGEKTTFYNGDWKPNATDDRSIWEQFLDIFTK